MKLKGYMYNTKGLTKYEQYLDCKLNIKNKNIVKIKIGDFPELYPKEYHSESSNIIELNKSHRPKSDLPKKCNYFIKYQHKDKLESIYLNISYLKYLRLKWVMDMYFIQSKDFKLVIISAIVGGVITYLITPKC